nr:hypothetical protein [Tanacetum cinerariifolium]
MVTPAPQDRWSQDKHIKLVNIISNQGARMLTRAMAKQLSATSAHECLIVNFLFKEEPKKVSEAPNHPGWVDAMQDELNQFARNKVRTLVPAPYGYNQQEGKYYDETFALVARLKAIKIFLAFATYMNFIVYQMDVKSAFLNGKLKEVYVKQPLGFKSNEFPNHVCKLDKALYGLKQAPSECTKLCKQFAKLMTQRYEMSMMGALTYFLGFQTRQSERGILINQEKYIKDLLKKYDINGSLVKTPIVPPNNLEPDLNGKSVNETQYRANPKESHLIDVKRNFKYLKDATWTGKAPQAGIKGDLGITTFRNALREQYIPYSSGKICGLDQISNKDATILYCLANGVKAICNIDVLVDFKAPKPSLQTKEIPQGKNPRVKSGHRRKQTSKHTYEFTTEASKSQTGQSKKETKSSSAKDKSPSHPLPPTPVVGEMHKEAQQAAGGPTSLGATSKEGAHPQLSSNSTGEADPGISAPNDSIS